MSNMDKTKPQKFSNYTIQTLECWIRLMLQGQNLHKRWTKVNQFLHNFIWTLLLSLSPLFTKHSPECIVIRDIKNHRNIMDTSDYIYSAIKPLTCDHINNSIWYPLHGINLHNNFLVASRNVLKASIKFRGVTVKSCAR